MEMHLKRNHYTLRTEATVYTGRLPETSRISVHVRLMLRLTFFERIVMALGFKTITREVTLKRAIKDFPDREMMITIGKFGIIVHEKHQREARMFTMEQLIADVLLYGKPTTAQAAREKKGN